MSRLRLVLAAAVVLGAATGGYAYSTYAKWTSMPVTFYANTANADVSTSAAAAALQYAMNVWSGAGSAFRFQYGGSVNDTATAHDHRNVIIFRNTKNGGAIGTTYSWWDSNNRLLDSDIIFWDAYAKFFTGASGCGTYSNAAYLEDIAAHELGHAMGLNHSSILGATMYSGYSYCSQALRTLAADDIAAAKALYPVSVTNTPPTVTITSPANGATFALGSTISLAGTASDAQDGNISSRIQWTDNGVAVGSGSLLSSILSLAGIHTFVAKVTDNNGAQASSQVSVTITLLASPSPTATLTYTTQVLSTGSQRVYLTWTGLAATQVDLFRNNVKIASGTNTGGVTNIVPSGPGTYYYYVCGTGTATCTNTIKVVF